MSNVETRQAPRLEARAAFVPSTVDREKRTVEITWTTGARVLRGFWDTFWEELSLNPKHVRLERLNSGRAPFLMDHENRLRAVAGVIERAWLTKTEGRAVVRFLRAGVDPAVDQYFERVADAVAPNVSVGYRVHKFVKVEGGEDKVPVMRAEDWTPHEVSGVAIGADAGASARGASNNDFNNCTVITLRGIKMDGTNETNAGQVDSVRAERERVQEIAKLVGMKTVRDAVEPGFLERVVSEGLSVDKVRALVLEAVAERSAEGGPDEAPSGAPGRYTDHGQRGNLEDFTRAAADALVLRSGIKLRKPHAAAADLMGTSVAQIAQLALSRSGTRPGYMSASGGDVIKRAMHSSSFPLILSNAIGTAIRNGYETEPASHRQWVRPETVMDFKEYLAPILSSAPDLDEVAELGEYRNGVLTEDAATYRVRKYGKVIQLSWEILKNDRLNQFIRIQPALGAAARRKEADLAYQLLKDNSGSGVTLPDGKTLFHADHKNVVTAAAPMDTGLLSAGRVLMRRQRSLGAPGSPGGELNLAPRFLIVSPEHEDAAERLIAGATRVLTSSSESNQTRWISSLELVVESRLSPTAAYLACDGSQVDTITLATLDENQDGPTFEEDAEFRRDVYSTKVRHVFGAAALDYRGLVKMPISNS